MFHIGARHDGYSSTLTKLKQSGSDLKKAAINKLTPQDRSLTVSNDTTIDSADVVRDIGVFLDTELSMKQHFAKVGAACFYHIRRLRQIRRRVGQAVLPPVLCLV